MKKLLFTLLTLLLVSGVARSGEFSVIQRPDGCHWWLLETNREYVIMKCYDAVPNDLPLSFFFSNDTIKLYHNEWVSFGYVQYDRFGQAINRKEYSGMISHLISKNYPDAWDRVFITYFELLAECP